MSLTKLLPIPDKWKQGGIVYKIYELGHEGDLHSPCFSLNNMHFIGKSYRCFGQYPIWINGTDEEYPTGWHSLVSLKGARKWLKAWKVAIGEDRGLFGPFVIVKVQMNHPVAYGNDELGGRIIVYKHKTLIEEIPNV